MAKNCLVSVGMTLNMILILGAAAPERGGGEDWLEANQDAINQKSLYSTLYSVTNNNINIYNLFLTKSVNK